MKFFILSLILLSGSTFAKVKGHIDSVVRTNGKVQVSGWACDYGVNTSIAVHLYANQIGKNHSFITSVRANQKSETGVSIACGTKKTNHRFRIEISGSNWKKASQKQVFVYGISTKKEGNLYIGKSGKYTFPKFKGIIGHIDSLKTSGADYIVSGWACEYGNPASIGVHIYTGTSGSNKSFLEAFTAKNPSGSGVREACGTNGNHRFSYKITASNWNKRPGHRLYLHGISTKRGQPNLLINKSGQFKFPLSTTSNMQGHIDGVFFSQGSYQLRGWSCIIGRKSTVELELFSGNPNNGGKLVQTFKTNSRSEGAVGRICKTSNAEHRFSINLSRQDIEKYANTKLYVSLKGQRSQTLRRSGDWSFPRKTEFGIMYLTWHCAVNKNNDMTKASKGESKWGGVPSFHWSEEPKLGYYCLSTDDEVLKAHAELILNAGIDFIVLDMSNHPTSYNPNYSDSANDQIKTMITKPIDNLIKVWSSLPRAPKIVPFFPVDQKESAINPISEWFLDKMNNHSWTRNLYFNYLGKPLILTVKNSRFRSPHQSLLQKYRNHYTVRNAWGLLGKQSDLNQADMWTIGQNCLNDFLEQMKSNPKEASCNQFVAQRNGKIEQIAIKTAYQNNYMSQLKNSTHQFGGNTFLKQFSILEKNPNTPIAILNSWNENAAQRFSCVDRRVQVSCDVGKKVFGNPCRTGEKHTYNIRCSKTNPEFQEDGRPVFVDQYIGEYNKDIEPGKYRGDKLYKTVKKKIIEYKLNR